MMMGQLSSAEARFGVVSVDGESGWQKIRDHVGSRPRRHVAHDRLIYLQPCALGCRATSISCARTLGRHVPPLQLPKFTSRDLSGSESVGRENITFDSVRKAD